MLFMIHNIDAIYDHGVFRPIKPLELPEGALVHLRVEQENGSPAKSSEYDTWLESLAGRWQGEFIRGDEGDVETREPL
jgi:predicted DNA-binding antitoxin AbrB/MazE fold protein